MIDKNEIASEPLPDGIDISDGLDFGDNCGNFERDEQILFSSLATSSTTDFQVFYIEHFHGHEVVGLAYPESCGDYGYNIVISAEGGTGLTLPHELGHITGQDDLEEEKTNLMYKYTGDEDKITAPKRLWQEQIDEIREDSHFVEI